MAAHRTIIIIVFVGFIATILSFNLETRIPIVKFEKNGTYFGFSVAQHRMILRSKNESHLLVGAPLAQTAQIRNNRSGALYRCSLSTYMRDCEQIKIDIDLDPQSINEIRDNQWLGVVVKSEEKNDQKVLVCAHRYTKKGVDYRWIYGLCYTLTNALDYDATYEACLGRPVNKGHEQFGTCQSGTSAALTEDGYAVLGAPGSFTWRGMIFMNPIYSGGSYDRRWIMSPYLPSNSPVNKYSYLGFSVVTAKFYPNATGYAAGAPRSNGSGQVVLFKKSLSSVFQVEAIITGDMFASSFGYEVAATDLNNDGLADLIVGAPFFFDKDHGGAIYVYMNGPMGITNETTPIKVLGKKDSRFGLSLSPVGDLNKDGFQDFAVGAPYEGSGAVYVFHGSKSSFNTEPTQIIRIKDLPDVSKLRNVTSFGYSLSGGMDLDGNSYPDLLIGAYNSDTVVLLRSRPVINILTEVQEIPKNINPLEKVCPDGQNALCFQFRPCFKFESSAKQQLHSNITMNYRIEAETFHTNKPSRAVFKASVKTSTPHINMKTFQQTLPLTTTWSCLSELVYIKNTTLDYLNSIKFKMTYKINQTEPKMPAEGDPLPNIDNFPILDQKEASKIFQVDFRKNCGDDDICVSNLILKASYNLSRDVDGKYYFSVFNNEGVILEIILENESNESAYETVIDVYHYPDIGLISQMQEGNQYRFELIDRDLTRFSIGNPFSAGEKAVLQLKLPVNRLSSEEESLKVTIVANTTSKETTVKEPIILEAKIIISADISIEGASTPSQVFYGGKILGETGIKQEEQIGEAFILYYVVKNNGPEVIESFDVIIDWPYEVATDTKYQNGKWLLYMVSHPLVEGFGECKMGPRQVNPLNIRVNDSATQQSREKKDIQNLENPNHIIQRHKREEMIVRSEEITENNKVKTVVIMECGRGSARCFKFSCNIKYLNSGSSVNIKMHARIWSATLVEDYPRVDSVRIYTNASIYIESKREVVQNVLNDRNFTVIEAIPEPSTVEPEGPPLWVIILSVLAGILLVALLVFCLWKLGFFKRNKPDALVANSNKDHIHADL